MDHQIATMLRKLAAEVREMGKRRQRRKVEKCTKCAQAATALGQLYRKLGA